ncbi:membrane protein [Bacillus coahuilensis p1.1.43]|uniref:Membrane protein n=1 Tax=Bacillus coahuilensis p1.1.43 TaxID=1150625 RepID=A0A147K3T3_9BACI|nr:DUF421 domain-containing protein [Bacillus coahuilensis]KUP03901.1 membrane protein [Bacillus coahuilensis p1.1.43]
MEHYMTVAVELAAGLLLLFIITKVLGKTQFSQITPFDFISALVLGELVGNAIYDHEVAVQEILFSTIIWGVMIYFIELVTQKIKWTRKLLEGEPNIVVRKGLLQYKVLKKCKLDINQLMGLIRQQGYFSLEEIEYAIIETNGIITVLPKPAFDVPKTVDFNFPLRSVDLPIILIEDGEIVKDNLIEIGQDENWLLNQLEQKNVARIKDVLYAEWKKDRPLYILTYTT